MHSPQGLASGLSVPRLKRQESISVLEPWLTGTWLGYFLNSDDDEDAALTGPQRLSIKLKLDHTNTISASSGSIITLKGGIVTSDFFFHGELFNINGNPKDPCGIHL